MTTSQLTLQSRLLSHARFRHMQVMVAVAELGSLRRAAESVGISQPAASKVVADLESLLEVPLFERHARGVHPTEECRELLVLARQTLHGIAAASAAVAARSRHGDGTVRIAGTVAAINGLLIPELPGFMASGTRLQLQITEGLIDDVLLSAARGELDLILCRRPVLEPAGWEFEELQTDEFKVFCAPNHPLLGKKRITAKDVFRENWLPGHPDAASRAHLENLARDTGQDISWCEIMTIHPTANWTVLRSGTSLMLAPVSVFRPYLIAGELRTIDFGRSLPFEPLGMMLPTAPRHSATARLAAHLQKRYRSER